MLNVSRLEGWTNPLCSSLGQEAACAAGLTTEEFEEACDRYESQLEMGPPEGKTAEEWNEEIKCGYAIIEAWVQQAARLHQTATF